ncbi:MAG: hypothetical protein HY712_06260 [candidate division NC10 bacterium]|nr:hypothetical protein [candidate division NC10 bacterium]
MEPDIRSIRRKHEDSRTLLDNLLKKLPGFKGYMHYRERYASDRMMRTYLADVLISCKGEVDAIAKRLAQRGELAILPELNGINETLEKNAKTCQAADFGASSSFSSAQAKFTSADQDRLIQYDTSLLGKVEAVRAAVAKLAGTEQVDAAGIGEVFRPIKEFERAFADRQHVLMGG